MTGKRRPALKIVNDDGIGINTRVLTADDKPITGVTEIQVSMKVGEPVKAKLHVIGINGEFSPEIIELEKSIVPPPLPVEHYELRICSPTRRWWGGKRCFMLLEKHTPLNSYGAAIETLAADWIQVPRKIELPATFTL